MQLQPQHSSQYQICEEKEIFSRLLDLDGKHILELGCGKAEHTRWIASEGSNRSLVATEVDEIQHKKNLLIDDLQNVEFKLAGGQDIPEPDSSFDIVLMFKSLHHVPTELMDQTLMEIVRVLKPGGVAYLSEPIFAGDFNALLSLFHNEEVVRQAAFDAIERAVDQNKLILTEEVFFQTPVAFSNFADYEQKVLQVTHTTHQLSEALHKKVEEAFAQKMGKDGAHFLNNMRVDLLQKPSKAS